MTVGAGRAVDVLAHWSVAALPAGVLGAALATASWWPLWKHRPVAGAVIVLVTASFLATAAILHLDPEHRATARALGLAPLFYLTSWWWAWPVAWHVGPVALVGYVASYLFFVLGGVALVRYPRCRLDRHERAYFVALTAWACGGRLVLTTVSEPGWANFGAAAWWPRIVPDLVLFDRLYVIHNAGLLVFVLALLALLVVRIVRASGLERVDAVPAIVSAGGIAVCAALYLGARTLGMPTAVMVQLPVATPAAALAMPVAFLAALGYRQVVRSSAVEMMPRIYDATAPAEVRDALRGALRDPEATLWLVRAGRYVDVDGGPDRPDAGPDGWLVPVRSGDGRELAVLRTRRSLRRHAQLVESATHIAGLVLERQATLDEVRASRARLSEAELSARQSIARDLHDGAQQVLLTARLRLATARRRAGGDTGVVQAIDQAGADVDAALDVVRSLAAGNAPSLLRTGLPDALAELVRHAEVPVELQISGTPFPGALERNLWFLTSEAITNLRRHAAADRACVAIGREGSDVVLRIIDDGRGGASPGAGTGLAGMVDRVHALGGQVEIHSPAGGGTTIRATLPCE